MTVTEKTVAPAGAVNKTAGLSPAAVRLAAMGDGTQARTVAELATASGMGRSTVSAALTALERVGRARRAPVDDAPGSRRGAPPVRWVLVPAAEMAGLRRGGLLLPSAPRRPQDVPAGDSPEQESTQEESSGTGGVNRGGSRRLAPGQLSDLVLQQLRADPAAEFTAGQIARELERSSGAVANALARFAKDGQAVAVDGRPQRYRAATS